MNFTPLLPNDNKGKIDAELLSLAETLCIESASLRASYPLPVINGIKDLLRLINSYYSNKIESEGTHPIDIDKASRQEFSSNSKKKDLQKLSLRYIEVQKYIENYFIDGQNPFHRDFILKVHYQFYSHSEMSNFLKIEDKDKGIILNMIAGEFRINDVSVGSHIAPEYKEIHSLFEMYETNYRLFPYMTQAKKVIYALASHHRLMWIHPFLDGNGRTARLVLDGIFTSIDLKGYGLWNISRGLSRRSKDYKRYLALADMPREGDLDGRGALSTKKFIEYIKFMLEVALDQVRFMNENLKINLLNKRIENYITLSREGLLEVDALPKYSEFLFKELLINGEVRRGDVMNIIGTKERTASKLISDLIKLNYLESETPKSAIRLKFNPTFASYIFPNLMPNK